MALSTSSPLEGLEDQPTIGFICPLYTDLAAILSTLDEELDSEEVEDVEYFYGRICGRIAVAVQLPLDEGGPVVTREYASKLLEAHPSLKHPSSVCFMVGTAGGVWTPANDVRLGDVVIATKTWALFSVRGLPDTNDEPEHVSRTLRQKLPRFLHAKEKLGKLIQQQVQNMQSTRDEEPDGEESEWTYPGSELDLLFSDDYAHVPGSSCASCDASKLVSRGSRSTNLPRVHNGIVASAESAQLTSIFREVLRARSVLAVDGDTSGLTDFTMFFVVRGVSHYADTHNNDRWEPYAAATAAACARLLIEFLVKPSQRQKQNASLSLPSDVSAAPSIVNRPSSLSPSPKPSSKGKEVLRKEVPETSATYSVSEISKIADAQSSEPPGYTPGIYSSTILPPEKKPLATGYGGSSAKWSPPVNSLSPTDRLPPTRPPGPGPGAPASVASFPAGTPAREDYPQISAWLSRTSTGGQYQDSSSQRLFQGSSGAPVIGSTGQMTNPSHNLVGATSTQPFLPSSGSYAQSVSSEGSYQTHEPLPYRPPPRNYYNTGPATMYEHTGAADQSVLNDRFAPASDRARFYETHVPQRAREFKVEHATTVESVKYKGIEQGPGTPNTQGPLNLCEVVLGYEAVEPWYESLRFLRLNQVSGYGQAKIWLPIDRIDVSHQGKNLSIRYCSPRSGNKASNEPNIEIVFEFGSPIPASAFVKALLMQGLKPWSSSQGTSSYWTVGNVRGENATDTFAPYGISNYLHLWTSGNQLGTSRYELMAFGDRLDFVFQTNGPTKSSLELSPMYCLDYISTNDAQSETFGKEVSTDTPGSRTAPYMASFGNFLDDGRGKRKEIPVDSLDVTRMMDCIIPNGARGSLGGRNFWHMVAYFDDVSFSFPKSGLKTEATTEAHLSVWRGGAELLFQMRSISKETEMENPYRWKSWEAFMEPKEPSKRLVDPSIITGSNKGPRKAFKFSDWRKKVTFEQQKMYVGDHISLKQPNNLHAKMEDGSESTEERTWTIHFEGRQAEASYKKLKLYLTMEKEPDKAAYQAVQGADADLMHQKKMMMASDYYKTPQNPLLYPSYLESSSSSASQYPVSSYRSAHELG